MLVDCLDGSETARLRLRIIIQTLTGELTISQACQRLGIGRSRFHQLRQRFLASATDLLEPMPRGPAPQTPDAKDARIAQLQKEIAQLKLDLTAAHVREEIALVMPHVLKNHSGKKTKHSARPNAKRGNSARLAR